MTIEKIKLTNVADLSKERFIVVTAIPIREVYKSQM